MFRGIQFCPDLVVVVFFYREYTTVCSNSVFEFEHG